MGFIVRLVSDNGSWMGSNTFRALPSMIRRPAGTHVEILDETSGLMLPVAAGEDDIPMRDNDWSILDGPMVRIT
jgi:hypothetical protein